MKNKIITLASLATLAVSANAQFIQTSGTQVTGATYRAWSTTTLASAHGINYDVNTDGFGTIATGLDLGLVSPFLAGITYSVSVADTNGAGASIFNTSGSVIDGVAVTFTFSEIVDAQRLLTNGYSAGEAESITGGDYYFFDDTVSPNLTFTGGGGGTLTWTNNTSGVIGGRGGSLAESYGVSTFTSAHNGAGANGWNVRFRVSEVPEPSSTALLGLGALGLLARRKR